MKSLSKNNLLMKSPLYHLWIILWVLLLSIYSVQANNCSNSCKIESQMAPVLQEYITNNRTVISNISAAVALSNSQSSNPLGVKVLWWEKNYDYAKKTGIRMYNSLLNWDDLGWISFQSEIEFFAASFKQSLPAPITRDLDYLKKENEFLNKFIKNQLVEWASDAANLDAICDWVPYCTLEGNFTQVVTKLLHNNNKIIEYYKQSLLYNNPKQDFTFLLVPTNFKAQFSIYYNKYTISDCAKCLESWFWKKAQKSLSKIIPKLNATSTWMQEWREAYALLRGTNNRNFTRYEKDKESFKNSLKSSWISSSEADTLKSLKTHFWNTDYDTWGSNPLASSFNTMKENLASSQVVAKWKSLLESFTQAANELDNNLSPATRWEFQKSVPLSSLIATHDNLSTWVEIMKKIDTLYQSQLPFISNVQQDNKNIEQKIINIHTNISAANNILNKTVPLSTKVCNDQDSGNWKCSY